MKVVNVVTQEQCACVDKEKGFELPIEIWNIFQNDTCIILDGGRISSLGWNKP
jgi:hypothetical protein